MTAPVQLLDRGEVRRALEWNRLVDVTRGALVGLASGNGLPSVASQLPVPGASLHLKTGALIDPPLISVKANLRPDHGDASGAILVFDHRAERVEAILSSTDLTAMRTAAIAAVAAEALAPDARDIGVLGAGPVAARLCELIAVMRPGARMRVWSRTPARAAALRDAIPGVTVVASIADAVSGVPLVATCTPARAPLVGVEDLASDVTVLAMGADSPGKRELGDGVLDGALLVADVVDDALAVGEFAALGPERRDEVGAIGSLLAGGPPKGGRRIVFDSVGSSAVDAAVVALVIDQARVLGLGHRFDLDRAR